MGHASQAITASVLTIGLAAGASVACFSEREATAAIEGVCSLPLDPGVPGSTIVVIRDFAFEPADVTVRPGERVTWINCDVDQHTSTAGGGEWSSPLLAPGDGFTTTLSSAGEFSYRCEPHPFMTARIIVE